MRHATWHKDYTRHMIWYEIFKPKDGNVLLTPRDAMCNETQFILFSGKQDRTVNGLGVRAKSATTAK
jgi:hypothetical protein